MMRDINRIDDVLEKIGIIWKQLPDWRFGQLIGNFIDYRGGNIFYIEDDDFIKQLADYMGATVQPTQLNAIEDKIDKMIQEMEMLKNKIKECNK